MNNETTISGIKPSDADIAALPFVDYHGMSLRPGERHRPKWIKEEGLCFVGSWHEWATRLSFNIASTNGSDDYAYEETRRYMEDVAGLGCNSIVFPYDSGHGEELNEREVRRTKKLVRLAHDNGLRAAAYFRPDIVWVETLSDEELREIDGGFQVNAQGRFVQPFGAAAVNVCYHHPGVVARFKRHVERAIGEIQVDMLHLDGFIFGDLEGSGPCRCSNCVRDFREFLVSRYGSNRELATSRFGHPFLEKTNPPLSYPVDSAPFDSGPLQPTWAEWVSFRCHWTSRIAAEVASWARAMNPEVAIEINNALPAFRENAALWLGTDVIGLGHYTDASWSEDGYCPRMHDNGMITHRIRQFKLCRAVDTFALTYMSETDERGLRQNLAHTAAFNSGSIGCVGFPAHMNCGCDFQSNYEVKRAFLSWLNKHREFFRNTRSAARIAVWRPREGMAMSGKMAYAAAMRIEQMLIETCRPFDVVVDESPSALSGYAIIIVPNVECMSLAQIDGVIRYVEAGGSVLIGQDSGAFDLWHRKRAENPWEALFGSASSRHSGAEAMAETPAGLFPMTTSSGQGDELTLTRYGGGSAVYAPTIVDASSQPSLQTVLGPCNCGLDYTNWVVPECSDELNRALDWLMDGKETSKVGGKRGLLAEYLAQDDPDRRLVHLVNMLPEPQRGCIVEIREPDIAGDISVLFPPTDNPPVWKIDRDGDVVRVVFDYLDVYAVVIAERTSIFQLKSYTSCRES